MREQLRGGGIGNAGEPAGGREEWQIKRRESPKHAAIGVPETSRMES